ncbi:transcriptional regulator [Streptomyces solincola]|uniref:Transcriptional regulator n=1 Tax=Streptomyces solincola TaxID=2100817 RepID=A0A2S9PTP0_9ACTN|nr:MULTISPECIES: helix-turn-helix domain-containing protein [Streptomyces]PRH77743.1 transcriptional regulator [Streptomyces solincola]
MDETEPRRITDLDTLKAFAHPLRIRLYRALFVARTATASHLAEEVDEQVALVSYHLRRLAGHGLIEEAPAQSRDGRERWWRPSSQGLSYRDSDFRDAPERAAASTALMRMLVEQRGELYRRHLDQLETWSVEWRDASFNSEYLPRLTHGEMADLQRELDALLAKYDAIGRAGEEAGETEGRENVAVHLYGFPFRG